MCVWSERDGVRVRKTDRKKREKSKENMRTSINAHTNVTTHRVLYF